MELPPEGFIRQRRLLEVVPLSKSTLMRRVAEGRFPPPVKLGARLNLYEVSEVRRWMAAPLEYEARPLTTPKLLPSIDLK